MKRNLFLLACTLLVCISMIAENAIEKTTYTYATKDNKELKLDTYAQNDGVTNKPCVIFLFGGGFSSGERNSERYMPYFNTLAEAGVVVVSADYRLGFKSDKGSPIITDENNFIKLFGQTIDMATEDLMDATSYVLYNADKLGINKKQIIVSGSSAGAITALHGEYALASKHELSKKLPDTFRYAGVISFAGAIFSLQGDLGWTNNPAPMLLFHGSADKNVPYDAIELGYLGFYGSKHIAKQLEELKVPYYFYDEEYAGHELADNPMTDNLDLVLFFVNNFIKNNKGYRMHNIVKVNDREPVPTRFSIKDYVKTNFPHD